MIPSLPISCTSVQHAYILLNLGIGNRFFSLATNEETAQKDLPYVLHCPPERLGVFHDRGAVGEGADPGIRHVLGEARMFIFASSWAVQRTRSEGRQDEDCRFFVTRL
jgi:hypothetical protein